MSIFDLDMYIEVTTGIYKLNPEVIILGAIFAISFVLAGSLFLRLFK